MTATARASQADLDEAVGALRAGGLVAFPTETVYGLGADASNAQAVREVFALKGRPANHPLIVHLHDAAQLDDWAREVTPAARRLAAAFWPGPLTLVLPRSPRVPDAVTGGQDTVALRVPSHPVARALLAGFGGGIAAPSANRYGRVSATCAAHVREEFGSALPLVLDGGDSDVGLESAIVSCAEDLPRLLRPGAITPAQLRAVAGALVVGAAGGSPRVPGSTRSHYAPRTPVVLVDDAALEAEVASDIATGRPPAVLARRPAPPSVAAATWIDAGADVEAYAHALYANLRVLDKAGAPRLLVQAVPPDEAWDAVRDRLSRAAACDDAAAPDSP
jgi:L-threonylcarbamoyladenylate synthase